MWLWAMGDSFRELFARLCRMATTVPRASTIKQREPAITDPTTMGVNRELDAVAVMPVTGVVVATESAGAKVVSGNVVGDNVVGA
jgi:hypothetical protein